MERNFNVSVVLGCVDKASAQLQKFNKSIQDQAQSLQTAGLMATAMGGSIVASLGLAARAAGQQELEMKKLEQAVILSGNSWEKSRVSIDGFVQSMQATTSYGDGDLIPMIQKMFIYTNDVSKAMDGVKIASNMASSGLMDLGSATKLVGMAINGNTEMLGRYIPELRESNNETLKTMTASEKAEYALGMLQKKFGGMAQAELQTFPALVKQLGNYFGDLTEDIGDKLLPQLKEFTKQATTIIQSIREWITQYPALASAIIGAVSALGALSLGVGSMILLLPKIIAGIKTLHALILANPYVAAALALAVLTKGVMDYLEASVNANNADYKAGKTAEDRIKIMREERDELAKKIKMYSYWGLETTAIENKLLQTVQGINYLKVDMAKQTNAQLLAEAQNHATTMEQLDMERWTRERIARMEYLTKFKEDEAMNNESILLAREQLSLSMVTGFQLAMDGMTKSGINWHDKFVELTTSITGSTSLAFQNLMKGIGTGWKNLGDFCDTIYKGIRDSVIKMISDIIAQEIIGYATRTAMSLLFKKTEIASNAAIGATRAAAASAWTLWGAIAIGAAVGAGIVLLAGKFATGGIVGGQSFTGDKVLAGVNSGEMILNRGQQANLFGMINGGGSGGGINIYVSGNQILNDRAADDLADKISDVIFRRVGNERRI